MGALKDTVDSDQAWSLSGGKYAEVFGGDGIKAKTIYGRGEIDLLVNSGYKRLAVVGSRRITDYGKQILEKIIPGLVSRGVVIVSGLMNGVDEKSHNMCLNEGGRTIAVLGWGIDYIYSNKLNILMNSIISNRGLVISEYQTNTPPRPWTFPQRNRIVVAISDVVLVIEGALGSGSMISADWARKLNKPLLVFPGPITSDRSEGVNMLLNKGLARAVTGVSDILEILKVQDKDKTDITSNIIGSLKGNRDRKCVDREERVIMEVLDQGEKTIDEITQILKISVDVLNLRVTVMGLKGLIEESGGYLRVKR